MHGGHAGAGTSPAGRKPAVAAGELAGLIGAGGAAGPDVDRLASHRHGRFLQRFAVRRVGVAGVSDVLAGRAEFHRLGGLGDHRARDGRDHPDPEHPVGLGVGDDLYEAVWLVVRLGPAVGEHRELADLHLAMLAGLRFGQADTRDLGHGVDDRRDHIVVHDAGQPRDIFGDGNALVLGLMRKHRAWDDVADGPDAGTEVRKSWSVSIWPRLLT